MTGTELYYLAFPCARRVHSDIYYLCQSLPKDVNIKVYVQYLLSRDCIWQLVSLQKDKDTW